MRGCDPTWYEAVTVARQVDGLRGEALALQVELRATEASLAPRGCHYCCCCCCYYYYYYYYYY